MTYNQIRAALDSIARLAEYDYEGAHAAEDNLREEVLSAIAKGEGDAKALAALALTSSDIKFARYCA